MNIRKPYTITESEKNRIRGLHANLKNVINEYYDDRTWEDQIKDLSKGLPDNPFGKKTDTPSEEDWEKGDRRYMEMGETALPTGWTMKTLEEVEEEGYMDDLYEVWSGQEDREALIESINDNGTSGEMVYELPGRFGNKRLTESQLINMINTIIK